MKKKIFALGMTLTCFSAFAFGSIQEIQADLDTIQSEISRAVADKESPTLNGLFNMGVKFIQSKLADERKELEWKLADYREDLADLENEVAEDPNETKWIASRKNYWRNKISKIELKLQLLDDLQAELISMIAHYDSSDESDDMSSDYSDDMSSDDDSSYYSDDLSSDYSDDMSGSYDSSDDMSSDYSDDMSGSYDSSDDLSDDEAEEECHVVGVIN